MKDLTTGGKTAMKHFGDVAASLEEPTNTQPCRDGPPVSMTIARGAAAHALVTNISFVKQWRALQESCSWSTSFQGPDFVAAWYDVYQARFEPLLVQGHSSEGELVGLLALAFEGGSRELVVAGTPQSEYQVWLAAPSWAEVFPREALAQLSRTSSWSSLTFEFLPSNTPLDWMRSDTDLMTRSRLEAVDSPLVELCAPDLKMRLWKSRTSKSHLNRLQRIGRLSLERVSDPEQCESLLDEIAAYYDVRIGGLAGLLPFRNDPGKKRFLLRLMAAPNLLHVSVLRSGSTLLAANVGFCHRGTVGLDLLAHSPFYARHSPGKIHVLLLAERLVEEEFTKLDLTPDGHWKEQLATCQETVHKLTVYLRPSANLKSRLRERIKDGVKRLLQKIGVNPQRLAAVFHRVRTLQPRHLPQAIRLQAARMFAAKGLQIYSLKPAGLTDRANTLHTSVDRLDHLLAGVDGAGRSEVKSFFSSALKRFEAGCCVHTCLQDGKLGWSCWSIAGNGQIAVPQVEPTFVPPARSAVLFAFRTASIDTAEVIRACLLEVLHHLAMNNELDTVYLLIDAHALQMCRVAESIGALFERTHHQTPSPQHPAGEGEVKCPSATNR